MRGRLIALLCVAVLFLGGCGGGGGSRTDLEPGPAVTGFAFTSDSGVAEDEPIDSRFTCDGEDASPALSWHGVPEGTEELALVLEDPDAPGATFTHWLASGLHPRTTSLAEGVGSASILRLENDFERIGYSGPCPPEGEEHHYVFRLFALDRPIELKMGADRAAFDEAVAPHVVAEARLTATYVRK